MKLKLKRTFKGNYTIGELFIDGVRFCDTLEDRDRGLTNDMTAEKIKSIKVYSKTAIPTGTYKIEVTFSPKFKRKMPIVVGVKGFSGIRIHNGSTEHHTAGCILLGENTIKGQLTNSKVTTAKLYAIIENAINDNEDVTITIE